MSEHNIVVRVIRKLDDDCPDKISCPARIKISTQPGKTVIVGTLITDPAEAAALGDHIGPGEGALLVPDEVLEEA